MTVSQRIAVFCLVLLVYSLIASELIIEPYEKPEDIKEPKVKKVLPEVSLLLMAANSSNRDLP
jgi:hypothetical protein